MGIEGTGTAAAGASQATATCCCWLVLVAGGRAGGTADGVPSTSQQPGRTNRTGCGAVGIGRHSAAGRIGGRGGAEDCLYTLGRWGP